MAEKTLVRKNAETRADYAPYCCGCRTMDRMAKVEDFYWRCRHCGAEHDERGEGSTNG